MRKVYIYDTTLREGEQAPGFSMSLDQKIEMAKQLSNCGVDVIEAGFPRASQTDASAVKKISQLNLRPELSALCRARQDDIELALKVMADAPKKRIHIFSPASDIQINEQFHTTRERILEQSVFAVRFARLQTDTVQFSAMDATRAYIPFLIELFSKVIEAGAQIINLSDTVGASTPLEFLGLVTELKHGIRNLGKTKISVHCHNDLGLATANSLSSLEAGVHQVECTCNGIGERAGNAALEEVATALAVKPEWYRCNTGIRLKQLVPTSKLLSLLTGIYPQPNKAVVGANAFLHKAGIHQDGVTQNPSTYELFKPTKLGLRSGNFVIGRHSGKSGLKYKLRKMKIHMNEDDVSQLMKNIKSKVLDGFELDDETLASFAESYR